MSAAARSRRDTIRGMLADLKMPGALEAVDGILSEIDGGRVAADRGDQAAARRADHPAQQPPAAGGDALLPAAGGEDAGELRLLLPALDQARADREPARARLRRAQGERGAARVRRASARPTWRSASPSPPRRAAGASTTARWSISSPRSRKPRPPAISPAGSPSSPIRRCWWSTRSATCRSAIPAPCCSSS